jgi:hypothetical protein
MLEFSEMSFHVKINSTSVLERTLVYKKITMHDLSGGRSTIHHLRVLYNGKFNNKILHYNLPIL